MKRRWVLLALMSTAMALCTNAKASEALPLELSQAPGTQVLLVKNKEGGATHLCTATFYEKKAETWIPVLEMSAVVGKNGIAAPDKKTEGDLKTPSGVYSIGIGFGPEKPIGALVDWRNTGKNDYWIDDPKSDDYNTWQVEKDDPGKRWSSYEKLAIDSYKYAMAIEYNTNPVVKNKGSAIFMHIWRNQATGTAGCVAFAKENILALIRRIDPAQSPVIIIQSR